MNKPGSIGKKVSDSLLAFLYNQTFESPLVYWYFANCLLQLHMDLKEWEDRFIHYITTHKSLDDGSHDLHHFQRVWNTALKLIAEEQADVDMLVILTAAYFHDFISLPKNHPDAALSSKLCADKVAALLTSDFKDFPTEKIEGVQHAIQAHSFSANIQPLTIEAKILQDADRMEALGAIGIARVFYTAGLLQKSLFEPNDPLATQRELNDKEYALDHFQQKLLKLPAMMQTSSGRKMAEERALYLQNFLTQIHSEITSNW